jgi:hypothetical protein
MHCILARSGTGLKKYSRARVFIKSTSTSFRRLISVFKTDHVDRQTLDIHLQCLSCDPDLNSGEFVTARGT